MSRDSVAPRELREPELVEWGERIGSELLPPLWIALYGPLGAGKSVLARAVIRGAGISGHIPSPSFTLVQSYHSPRGFEINHVDLFRLRAGDTLGPLGWEDLLAADGFVLVEWANRAGEELPASRWEVNLDYGVSPETRKVHLARLGEAPQLLSW